MFTRPWELQMLIINTFFLWGTSFFPQFLFWETIKKSFTRTGRMCWFAEWWSMKYRTEVITCWFCLRYWTLAGAICCGFIWHPDVFLDVVWQITRYLTSMMLFKNKKWDFCQVFKSFKIIGIWGIFIVFFQGPAW